MNYLMTKAVELIGGLTGIQYIGFYPNTPQETLSYTNNLLVVDFAGNARKLYKYNTIWEQFEYIGKSSALFPVKLSKWLVMITS